MREREREGERGREKEREGERGRERERERVVLARGKTATYRYVLSLRDTSEMLPLLL